MIQTLMRVHTQYGNSCYRLLINWFLRLMEHWNKWWKHPWRKPITSQTSNKEWTRPELVSAQNFIFQISPEIKSKEMSPLLLCHSTCLRLSYKHNFLSMHFQVFSVSSQLSPLDNPGQCISSPVINCAMYIMNIYMDSETRTYSTQQGHQNCQRS